MSLFLTIGFTITMILSAMSWHYVEKPMMQFKPKRYK